MQITLDNQIVNRFLKGNFRIADLDDPISFRWPSLLEFLELGSMVSNLPPFDQSHPLFQACVATLHKNEEKEVLFYIYDRLFAENLTQIKALTQLNASFLLQAINERRARECEKVFSPALAPYEEALQLNASKTIHDLVLYLAWDRMCVCMARLFDYQSADPHFIKGLTVLKECLIESFQHITLQGHTSPGIYRMLEALVYYQMREENLEKHSPAQWAMLSQSFPVFKPEDKLPDFFYIDDAVILEEKPKEMKESIYCHLTLDLPDRVNARLALAQYMMDQLKLEIPQWRFALRPIKVIYMTELSF